MLADFLRGVTEDGPSCASGLDGLRALEAVLAAYHPAKSHEPENANIGGGE